MTTSQSITTIGLDLAKSVFQVHAIDEAGQVIQRRTIRRSQVLKFFQTLPPCLVGMEACASAHYWARELELLGHRVRIMPPAYVKRNKTDAADAEAICEAVTRPTMRFVPIKSAEQQADGMVIKTRNLLIRRRSQSVNALRAHMAELGIVAATGMASVAKLIERVRDLAESSIPTTARLALDELAGQIEMLTKRIEALDREIMIAVKSDPQAKRLTSIRGVGPMIAATVKAVVPDIGSFRTGRDFSAWIGLTPRSNSSGGKERLGSISKRGNQLLRTLLIVGATSILKFARRGIKIPRWLEALMQRRPIKVVAVALANKIARTIWALLIRGDIYRPSAGMMKA